MLLNEAKKEFRKCSYHGVGSYVVIDSIDDFKDAVGEMDSIQAYIKARKKITNDDLNIMKKVFKNEPDIDERIIFDVLITIKETDHEPDFSNLEWLVKYWRQHDKKDRKFI